ncbi:hypothetical protein MMC21_003763 [Puttea exsequens]|nr:hypothetical protein [Puttea exsequens]
MDPNGGRGHRTALLKSLLDRTSQPLLGDLGSDLNCNICHEPYLSGEFPELPLRLACKHIVGTGCILRWLNPSDQACHNSCPVCREKIFGRLLLTPKKRSKTSAPVPAVTSQTLAANETFSDDHQEDLQQIEVATPEDIIEMYFSAIEGSSTVVEESYADVASMFNAAELEFIECDRLRQKRLRTQRSHHLWLQFCEGVTREVENSNGEKTRSLAPVAFEVLRMQRLEVFLELKNAQSDIAQSVLRTFPRLHTELILRISSLRPIPGIDVAFHIDERQSLLGETNYSHCCTLRVIAHVRRQPRPSELGDSACPGEEVQPEKKRGDLTVIMNEFAGGSDSSQEATSGVESCLNKISAGPKSYTLPTMPEFLGITSGAEISRLN